MRAILETTGYRAPLALRGVDAVTGADVTDGLVALAWPAGNPAAAKAARHSPVSALLGFGRLPGLYAQEFAVAAGDATPTFPALDPLPFVVTVTDTLGRFLPEVLSVEAPRTTPVQVTLYSTPARPRPSGWATVYGEVSLDASGAPSAWALVRLTSGALVYQTVGDERGRFLFCLPYPEALPVLAGSPPAGGGIGEVGWSLDVSVNYAPASLSWPVNPAPDGPPDIASILAQQQAQIITGGGAHSSITARLSFGTPLLLRLGVVPA